ncbi:hypothetical protein BASA61_003498 [Batrachochytrium salamandrivorans]|nr:hypothetical protein BASA61_003498 [Batrachochytrium salamandrivorans]
MSTLEDIVASLTDRIRSLEIKNQALKQGIFSDSLHEPKAALPNKFDGSRRHFRGFINQLELVFQLQDQRYDTDRKKIATLGTLLTDKALSWFNPYIEQPERSVLLDKESQPCAIYAAEFRQLTADIDWNDAALRSQFYSGLSSANQGSLCQPVSRIHSQQYQHRYVDNFNRQPMQQPSVPTTATPTQQRPTSDDMDIDFARRGSLSFSDRQQRFSQEPYLVCGQSGHLKAFCPRSNSSFRPQRHIQAIEMEHSQHQDPRKRSRSTPSRDLDSAMKLIPPVTLRKDVMNMEDDDGLDSCKGDNSARADLQIPLLELSTPITLRLADGDSSSCLTHRTVPLQLHIGKHVETATFYVTDLFHGFILGYSWLERHNPRINWASRMVEFDSPFCLENCCVVSSRIQGLGKPPNISKTFDLPLTPDSISTPTDLSPINCSLSDSISLGSMQADMYPFVKVSPVSDISVPPDILSNFSLLFSKDRSHILTHGHGKLNSQITSLSCREDYKATSESFNFQRTLPFIES